MKTFKITVLTALVTVALPALSFAHTIDLGTFTTDPALGNPSAETTYVSTNYNGGAPLTFLTKEEGGSYGPDGSIGTNGDTYFDVTLGPGGTSAVISWDLTGSGFQLNFVLLKDGDDPITGNILYHIYSVSADEVNASLTPQTVFMEPFGTVNPTKAISHISFLGNPGAVPDSGMTVTLLGVSLAGLAVLRRRIALKR